MFRLLFALLVAGLVATVSLPTVAAAETLHDQWGSGGQDPLPASDYNNNGTWDPWTDGMHEQLPVDDFVVPAGRTWVISNFEAQGFYGSYHGSTAGPADSFDVYVYSGSGGPRGGATARIFRQQGYTPIESTGGPVRVNLATPLALGEGKHWIGIQARETATERGMWAWYTRPVTTNAVAQIFMGAGNINNCAPAWHTVAECWNWPGYSNDFSWRLVGFRGAALSYQSRGAGRGTVTSTPAGLNCGPGACTSPTNAYFPVGQQISFRASPASSFDDIFTGWAGCEQPNGVECVMNMNNETGQKTLAGNFAEAETLTFRKTGEQDGLVTASGVLSTDKRECPSGSCKAKAIAWKYPKNGQATLKAYSDSDARFAGWTGCDHPDRGTCVMDMTSDKSVSARYEPAVNVIVGKDGDGDGTLLSDPEGIDCPVGQCKAKDVQERLPANTRIAITATPDVDTTPSTFAGWTGCHEVNGRTCILNTGPAGTTGLTVHARFNPGKTVTVQKAGAGSGRVVSSVPGLDCGTVCKSAFVPGSAITLTAVPDPGSTFAGWGGACSGGGDCGLTMTGDQTVIAAFGASGNGGETGTPGGGSPVQPNGPFGGLTPPTLPGQGGATVASYALGAKNELKQKSGAVTVPMQCTASQTCDVSMQILTSATKKNRVVPAAAKAKVIGSGKTKIKPRKTGKVKVKLTKAARKQLKKRKKLTVTLKSVVKVGGTKTTVEKKATLKR